MTDGNETPLRLHEAARRRIGVPFDHKGRSEGALDCVGLGVVSARDLGWEVIDLAEYQKHPKAGLLERMLEANCGPAVARNPGLSDLQVDDLVAMDFDDASRKRNLTSRRPIRHVGIVGAHPEGGLSLIHTDSYIGRVVEQRIDETILARIAAVYRRAV